MEFTIPSPLGAQATIAAQQPARPAPDPTRVEKASKAGKTRADTHNATDHGNTQTQRHGAKRNAAKPPPDPNQPVGPPPSFQLNVLEMERELQQRLAQIEFSRSLEDQNTLQVTDADPENPVEPTSDTTD
ncbi:hypothetical protein ALP8811_01906 [Aliiroseovarius pelagivivens]|uniref:Uncharacterized protein n=1 Tax=Aliiroseovarius pelagivivens TaxID=1639690 RepID=A0A2R8ALT8_9RHOB|nr:hypothetical protein [Aliiroseovarius pelagivivens]SPF76889.1 hypothetical protein ALP8811_01906 [Aliiroseovarius pelagivivens]